MTATLNPVTIQAVGLTSRTSVAGRTSLTRQMAVEARKLVDTRSGFWLVLAGCLVTAAASALTAFLVLGPLGADPSQYTLMMATSSVGTVVGMFLALLGILTITTEWTQRTALVTFALEPRRGRVLLAKVGMLIGAWLLVVALSVAIGAVIIALTQAMGLATSWDLPIAQMAGFAANALFDVALGIALGLMLQHGAAAVVSFFALPMAATMVTSAGQLWEPLGNLAWWVAPNNVLGALAMGEMVGVQWLQLSTVLLIWVMIPAAIGTWRWMRRQVS